MSTSSDDSSDLDWPIKTRPRAEHPAHAFHPASANNISRMTTNRLSSHRRYANASGYSEPLYHFSEKTQPAYAQSITMEHRSAPSEIGSDSGGSHQYIVFSDEVLCFGSQAIDTYRSSTSPITQSRGYPGHPQARTGRRPISTSPTDRSGLRRDDSVHERRTRGSYIDGRKRSAGPDMDPRYINQRKAEHEQRVSVRRRHGYYNDNVGDESDYYSRRRHPDRPDAEYVAERVVVRARRAFDDEESDNRSEITSRGHRRRQDANRRRTIESGPNGSYEEDDRDHSAPKKLVDHARPIARVIAMSMAKKTVWSLMKKNISWLNS
ncbi:hypothetical protein LTR56_025107 [Elasticomyces elasticus]|nr:hypothetical protein LTR56_025107 [Elasticomyces elasticus]KAK3663261.1 hypothetical protein LTR22_005919 [Elasticomyces elasticus]KAK4929082.1 hypothetical protein LTR49_004279 [Elasticomyces elasticus]KAK5766461.1 hypothetical protein LTS12_003378 [Elasticomyces elasticus]